MFEPTDDVPGAPGTNGALSADDRRRTLRSPLATRTCPSARSRSAQGLHEPATRLRFLLALLFTLLLGMVVALPAAAETPSSWGQAGFFHQFSTDVDDDGDFDLWTGYAKGQFVARLDDRVHVRMLGSYYGSSYEWDDPPAIIGSATDFKPWNTIHVARLNPLFGFELDDRINLFAGPLLEASLENGADLSNSLKPGGLLGAEMQVNESLKVGLGVLGVKEIEDDFYIQPLLILDWQTPIENLSVHASSWTTRGGRFEIIYGLLDGQLEIAPSVTYRRERFRLKEQDLSIAPPPPVPVPRIGSKGVGEDRAVLPALRVSWLPDHAFVRDTVGALRIDLEAGVALAGDLIFETDTGSKIQTTSYDPAPTLGFSVSIPL